MDRATQTHTLPHEAAMLMENEKYMRNIRDLADRCEAISKDWDANALFQLAIAVEDMGRDYVYEHRDNNQVLHKIDRVLMQFFVGVMRAYNEIDQEEFGEDDGDRSNPTRH